MKLNILFFLLAFSINNTTLLAQNDQDTSYPTIENNPNVPLDLSAHAEPGPDNMKPKKHDRRKVTIGESKSFFTDVISGIGVLLGGILLVWLYRRWQSRRGEVPELEE